MKKKLVFAVASGGGHWVQLLRLRPAYQHHEVIYVSTNSSYKHEVTGTVLTVLDANLNEKVRLSRMFFQMFFHFLRFRPNVVITTGAAPGFAAVVIGRLFGARSIWIDSIANSEELSSSGKHVGTFANVRLTQWEHLAKPTGAEYWGSVI